MKVHDGLLLRAKQHKRLILRVWELIRVVDRSEPRNLPVVVKLDRGIASLEWSSRWSCMPLEAAALVTSDDMGKRRADPVWELVQAARQVTLDLDLPLGVQRHILVDRVSREQLSRSGGISSCESTL